MERERGTVSKSYPHIKQFLPHRYGRMKDMKEIEKKSLLEIALEYKPKYELGKNVSDEEIDLMLALMSSRVELYQARKVVGGGIEARFLKVIQEAYKRGLIEIKKQRV